MLGKDLLSVADLSTGDITALLDVAAALKAERRKGKLSSQLRGKVLGMIFQKPSLRTRVSFELGMLELGGHAMYLSPQEVRLGEREAVSDVARVLSRYVHAVLARTYLHSDVEELARHATVPVINGLSDREHPCQVLADLFTVWERLGSLAGRTLVFVGDGNNVANSLLLAAPRVGMNIRIACPRGFEPAEDIVAQAARAAAEAGTEVTVGHDVDRLVGGADIIYTDVWYSMGQEDERYARIPVFQPYQVNQSLLEKAGPQALVMHCLPAHRGEEITDDVLDGPRCIALDQAENRLHAQKALLLWLLGGQITGDPA